MKRAESQSRRAIRSHRSASFDSLDLPIPLTTPEEWVPYGIRRDASGLVIDWCDLAERRLDEPFFDQAVRRLLHEGKGMARTTRADVLESIPDRSPAGFLFHSSRCGSTLVSRMLDAVPRFASISEPAILETTLRGDFDADGVPLLRAVMSALVRRRAERTFVKFSARAIVDSEKIERAYPGVPSVFLYRHPTEVVVSLVGAHPDRLPPGLSSAGLLDADPQMIRAMRPAEFWARVVGRECAAALQHAGRGRMLFVNYHQLPAFVGEGVVPFFGAVVSPREIERMNAVSRGSAKNPATLFRDDSLTKREAATAEIHTAVDRFAAATYHELERARLAPD